MLACIVAFLSVCAVDNTCSIIFPTGQFNVLIVPLQKFLAKVTPRLSASEPVYGNKDTVERLIDSHQVSIMNSAVQRDIP